MKWQPIETAPRDGTGFIYYQSAYGDLRMVGPAIFDGEVFRAVDYFNLEDPVIEPTHWMPLPPAPETK